MPKIPQHISAINRKKHQDLKELISDMPLLKDYLRYQYRSDSHKRVTLNTLDKYLRLTIKFFTFASIKLDFDFLSHKPKDARLEMIRFGFVDDFIEHLEMESLLDSFDGLTTNNYIISVNSFFNWAYEFEYINRNHVKKSILPDKSVKTDSDKKGTIILTDDEALALLNLSLNGYASVADTEIALTKHELAYHKTNYLRNHCITCLMLFLGLRLQEVTNLNITDIDHNNKKIRLFRKGYEFQELNLGPDAYDAVNDYIKAMPIEQRYCPALFSSKYGGDYNRISKRQIAKIIKKYLNVVNPGKFTPHKLRSTLATKLIQQGHSLYYVAYILNHKTQDTTKKYIKEDAEVVLSILESVTYEK